MSTENYLYEVVEFDGPKKLGQYTTSKPAHRIGHRITFNGAEYTVRTWGAPPATPRRILYVTPA